MNLLILKIERSYIKNIFIILFFAAMSLPTNAWDVDFSRRSKNVESKTVDELRWPSSIKPAEELFAENPSEKIFGSLEPSQSIAILNTEKGFVPDTIRLRKDGNYKIFIANVNEKNKNASFILDAFGQSHGIYFGRPKNFDIVPKATGIFTFISPESGAQGKVIVYSDKDSPGPVAVSQKRTSGE